VSVSEKALVSAQVLVLELAKVSEVVMELGSEQV
jgi:hypothetical protein